MVISPALTITGSPAAVAAGLGVVAAAVVAAGLLCAIAIVATNARAMEIVVVFFTIAPYFGFWDGKRNPVAVAVIPWRVALVRGMLNGELNEEFRTANEE